MTMKPEDWIGKVGKTFKTDEGETAFDEYFLVVAQKNGTYCTHGSKSKKNCFKVKELAGKQYLQHT